MTFGPFIPADEKVPPARARPPAPARALIFAALPVDSASSSSASTVSAHTPGPALAPPPPPDRQRIHWNLRTTKETRRPSVRLGLAANAGGADQCLRELLEFPPLVAIFFF